MPVTNKNVFKKQVQAHILGSLCTDYTEIVKEQLEDVVNSFNSWYSDYEQKRTPNRWEAFKDWLRGLPSEINAEYEYYTISQTLKTWFETAGETYKEQPSEKEAALYYALVVREFLVLCRKHNVDPYPFT